VGFFETWSSVQQARFSTPTWNGEKVEWVRHFPPTYNRKHNKTSTNKNSASRQLVSKPRVTDANAVPVALNRRSASTNDKKPAESNGRDVPKKKTYAAATKTSKTNTELKRILTQLLATL
jgi:hypothetical protein